MLGCRSIQTILVITRKYCSTAKNCMLLAHLKMPHLPRVAQQAVSASGGGLFKTQETGNRGWMDPGIIPCSLLYFSIQCGFYDITCAHIMQRLFSGHTVFYMVYVLSVSGIYSSSVVW
uniref:Uncharacterized protein n=1 Tax=Physcomitrium patens TaxID=3218 RepID=A0A7I4FL01_PHYPA